MPPWELLMSVDRNSDEQDAVHRDSPGPDVPGHCPDLKDEVWGTVQEWAEALGVPEVALRRCLEGAPSRRKWVHLDGFDYVTESFGERDVAQACSELLAPVFGV
jgi:hypothetical protein